MLTCLRLFNVFSVNVQKFRTHTNEIIGFEGKEKVLSSSLIDKATPPAAASPRTCSVRHMHVDVSYVVCFFFFLLLG